MTVPAMGETLLRKGEDAPHDGLLLTIPQADAARKGLIERDGYESLNKSLEKSLTIQKDNYSIEQQKTSILTQRNDELAKELKSASSMSNFEKVFYFILGGAAMYGAYSLAK